MGKRPSRSALGSASLCKASLINASQILRWDIEPLSSLSPHVRLGRFFAMTLLQPHRWVNNVEPPNEVYEWRPFFDQHLSSLLETFPRAQKSVLGLVKSTNHLIYPKESDRDVLKALRKRRDMKSAGPDEMRQEALAAARRFLSFDWTHLSSALMTHQLPSMLTSLRRQ